MNIVPQLTTAGQSLLITALSGGSINFTKIVVGDGAEPSSQSSLTNLVNPLIEMAIEDFVKGDACVSVTGSLTNDDVSEGFYWKETGLFAEDGDGNEVLYAYCHTGDLYEYIPSNDSGKSVDIQLTVMVAVDDAENVTATISDNGTYVLKSDFNSHINDTSNPHSVTLSQLGAGTAAEKDVDTAITENSTNLPTSGAVYNIISAAVEGLEYQANTMSLSYNIISDPDTSIETEIGTNEIVENSNMLVTSGAVYSAINDLPTSVTELEDANGSIKVYLSDDTDYEISLTTSTISSSSKPPTSKAVYEALKGLVPANYIIAASDTPGELAKQADYVCDNSSTYIARGIESGIEALGATGGKIVILPGTYNYAFGISISADNVTVEGFGDATQLVSDDNTSYGITISGNHNKLRNLSYECPPGALYQAGLIISGNFNTVEGVTFTKTMAGHPMIYIMSGAYGNVIMNCYLTTTTSSDEECMIANYSARYLSIMNCFAIGLNEENQEHTYYTTSTTWLNITACNLTQTETEPS